MKKDFELVQHSKIRHLNIFTIHITYRNFHAHSDFELLLILGGHGKIRIKNDVFSASSGDIIFVNPHDMHEIDSRDGGLKILIVQFSRHLLYEYFPALRNTCFYSAYLRDVFSPGDYTDILQTLIKLAGAYGSNEPFFSLHCLHFLTRMLLCFYEKLDYDILDETAYLERKKKSGRVYRIAAYIDEHYTDPVRLQDIAETEQISTTRLSHFFTENFGISFQEYLTDKRLEQALRLAGSESLSLAALSELSGFSDPKYLHKAFLRKFGYPFSEYQKTAENISGQNSRPENTLEYYYTPEESRKILEEFSKLSEHERL